jgi:cell division septation protein DedD
MQNNRQKDKLKLISLVFMVLALFLAACGAPAPEAVEHLDNTAVWVKIADEKRSFTVSGTKIVRYGAGTRWVQKSVTGSGYCGNWFFGSDPARGVVKSCEVQQTPSPSQPTTPTNPNPTNPTNPTTPTNPNNPAPAATWTKIADEKTNFRLSETKTVRFGTDNRWLERTLNAGTHYCHRSIFGGTDPAEGVFKRCEVLTQSSAGTPTNPTPTNPTPTNPNPTNPTPTDPTPDPEPTPDPNPVPTPIDTGATVTVRYQKDNSNFLNPERGYSNPQVSYSDNPKPLESWRLEQTKAQGISVINRRYVMVSFRNSPISQGYLDHIQADMNLVRQYGMKMVIRFSYTFNESGGNYADTNLSRMLSHVEQLRPVLQRNVDVIAFLEAGFIGRWGEWNKSTNGLGDETNPQNTAAQSQLVNALLNAVPRERMVTIRYLGRKKAIVSSTPLRADQAYNGSAQARTGHMNDYFTIDDWSGSDRTYLSQDTLFTVQGGEPIRTNGTRSQCPATVNELETFNWSVMNIPGSDFTSIWRNGGCYDSIAKRLGYRFYLNQATIPAAVNPGSTLSVSLSMTNEGFARPYNPRGLELVLRNRSTNQVTRLNVNPGQDVRSFLPNPDETKTLTLNVVVPANLAAGNYDIFLNLPDPAASLNTRPEYSIRLANTNMWESSTGYNRLGSLQVGANANLLANAQ